jgi:hypothetical protein
LFASVSLLDSMNFSFDGYFDSNQYDLRAMAGALIPGENLEEQIQAVEGVKSVRRRFLAPSRCAALPGIWIPWRSYWMSVTPS